MIKICDKQISDIEFCMNTDNFYIGIDTEYERFEIIVPKKDLGLFYADPYAPKSIYLDSKESVVYLNNILFITTTDNNNKFSVVHIKNLIFDFIYDNSEVRIVATQVPEKEIGDIKIKNVSLDFMHTNPSKCELRSLDMEYILTIKEYCKLIDVIRLFYKGNAFKYSYDKDGHGFSVVNDGFELSVCIDHYTVSNLSSIHTVLYDIEDLFNYDVDKEFIPPSTRFKEL